MKKRFRMSDEPFDKADYAAELLKSLQATTEDYLKYTYFSIFDNTEDSTLKQEFYRRCHTIIFNNHLEISKRLAQTVFLQKADECLVSDLREAKFVSCIYPQNFYLKSTPLLIQYFHKTNGLQHRLLQYLSQTNDLVNFLNDLNITEKFVGFCGDYSFMDPNKANFRAEYFKDIRNFRNIYYLPYCDSFLDNLTNLVVGYLPKDISLILKELGNYLLESCSTNGSKIQIVKKEFKKWKLCKKEHIIFSSYTQSVIDNFAAIKRYLSKLVVLPRVLKAFNSIKTHCLIVFIRDIFYNFKRTDIKENFALLFYKQIKEIQARLELYESDCYFPNQFYKCIEKQEQIIKNELLDPEEEIKKLNKSMFEIVDKVYKQAIMYLQFLSTSFKDFDNFFWVLLESPHITFEYVHTSFHIVRRTSICDDNCNKLTEEVEKLNQLLSTISFSKEFLEIKWIQIFKELDSIPTISDIVRYVLSLPASTTSLLNGANDLEKLIPDDKVSEAYTKLKFSFRLQNSNIENMQSFFGEEYVRQAEQIIEKYQKTRLID